MQPTQTKQHTKPSHTDGRITRRWLAHSAELHTSFAQMLDALIGPPGATATVERTPAGIRIDRDDVIVDVDTQQLAAALGMLGAADEIGLPGVIRDVVVRAIIGHAVTATAAKHRATPLPEGALEAALARAHARLAHESEFDAAFDAWLGGSST
jgi:hypothetical protein